jgi:hypothetical protein
LSRCASRADRRSRRLNLSVQGSVCWAKGGFAPEGVGSMRLRIVTAGVAVQGAVDDALISANGEGFFNCAPVGSPRIFETFTDPFFGHVFFAEADVSCTP